MGEIETTTMATTISAGPSFLGTFTKPAPTLTDISQLPWYGIHTRSNQEKLVAASLQERGLQPFLPLYRTRRQWSDRVVTTESPLFSGYVFCRLEQEHRLPVITAPGVVSILGFGNHPEPIPEEQIDAIRAIIAAGTSVEPAPLLREGQRIRVTSGPLQSLEGTLVRKKSNWRLVVSVEMLQRAVSVEIDPAHVQAL